MKSKGLDRMMDQGGEALGVVADLFLPGLREKLTRAAKEREPAREEPRASDVVAPSEDACPSCEGAGELQNVRGRMITCGFCGGRGTRG